MTTDSLAFSPLRYLPIGSSSRMGSSFGQSYQDGAVNILVTEPTRKSVSGVTGAPVSILSRPQTFRKDHVVAR